jgi:hypothetical protein
MRNMALVSLLFAFVEAGCAAIIAEQRRQDEARCVGEGFQPGTDGFRLCRLTIEQIREKRAAEERRREQEKEFRIFMRCGPGVILPSDQMKCNY